jgi:hypothetical protein
LPGNPLRFDPHRGRSLVSHRPPLQWSGVGENPQLKKLILKSCNTNNLNSVDRVISLLFHDIERN